MEGMVMGASVERFILISIVVISCLCAWRASATQPVTVKKIYHHRAVTDQNVELGSCVLYGGGLTKGSITETSRIVGDKEERVFIIPRALVNTAECRQMIDGINKSLAVPGYALTIENIKKPEVGLALHFSYPKDKCIISCKHFDSIQREKGIVFNVYNKSLVHNLKKRQEPVIRTAAANTPRIIFLDPGHGGVDSGALAASGIAEKDICLAVSLEVQKILTQVGYTVCLSRDRDEFVPLDVRTYKAHEQDADLLVSIHANASGNKDASGLEIFFLDPDFLTNYYEIEQQELSSVKLLHQKRSALSTYLAHLVHSELCKNAPVYNNFFKDRGIKKAVAQVLLGAYVPAVLIELGFMTHTQEAFLLSNKQYQRVLAQSIADGVQNYCMNMQV